MEGVGGYASGQQPLQRVAPHDICMLLTKMAWRIPQKGHKFIPWRSPPTRRTYYANPDKSDTPAERRAGQDACQGWRPPREPQRDAGTDHRPDAGAQGHHACQDRRAPLPGSIGPTRTELILADRASGAQPPAG